MLLGALGGRELMLIAAIAVLLAGISRVMGLHQASSSLPPHEVHGAPSRAYVDRLLG
jgi:hypothetical protein